MKLKWKGKMELVEQEGGYASSQLWIGNTDITTAIEDHFAGGKGLFGIEGEWKLTLEKVT